MIAKQIDTAPPVDVIIATRGRPEMLRNAVRSILGQDYAGWINITVVFDQIEIDPLADIVVSSETRSLRSITNSRTPGLAGGRNSGILSGDSDLVAFCDDDDEWMPSKLPKQIDAWRHDPDASLITTGIRIITEGKPHDRIPPARVEFSDLLLSRITEMHPSSFLARRSDLIDGFGLIDEDLPASYGEDYDLLLRAARHGHIIGVREPLVTVHWDRASFFSGKWEGIVDGLSYILAKYPEFADSPVGSARIEAQVAFALAALKRRAAAREWARGAIRKDRTQLRAYAALAIAARLVPAAPLVNAVNKRGRGL